MDDQEQNLAATKSLLYNPQHSINSNCLICSNSMIEPVGCSGCSILYCKACLVAFVLQNNKCPNGCITFKLLFPSKNSHPLLFDTFLECKTCKNLIAFINYGAHLQKCSQEDKQKRCWNCNSKVSDSSMVFKLYVDYQLTANYTSEISIEEDKPFLIQILYPGFKGYATELDKRLIVTDKESEACLFSQDTIEKQSYLKVFKKKVWKFLGPHYDLGILVVAYGKWSGSLILDANKQTITSNSGRTQGLYLTMRKSDNRLFFFKENDSYISCIVNVVPVTSLANIPPRHRS